MEEQIFIEDFDAVDVIVQQAANKLWKKSYKICWHVFGSFEDTVQTGWTALFASKKARAILAEPIAYGLCMQFARIGKITKSR